MNQIENCQARYRSNTWMGRTRTDGPDEFEPSKFDCTCLQLELGRLTGLKFERSVVHKIISMTRVNIGCTAKILCINLIESA